jgi:hypothetical protein
MRIGEASRTNARDNVIAAAVAFLFIAGPILFAWWVLATFGAVIVVVLAVVAFFFHPLLTLLFLIVLVAG